MAATILFAVMISLALLRPNIFGRPLSFSAIGLAGLALALLLKTLPPALALVSLSRHSPAMLTVGSLMCITACCREAGLIDRLCTFIVRSARGSAYRLMSFLFWVGTAFGTLFTNDAAVLLLTPLAISITQNWGADKASLRLPYLFAVLYIANLVGALVISNPINIIAAEFFNIPFANYAAWMLLPALSAMLVTWLGLLIAFRKELSAGLPEEALVALHATREEGGFSRVQLALLAILAVTLAGFALETVLDLPLPMTASVSALCMLVVLRVAGLSAVNAVKQIDFPILIFLSGLFVVAVAVRNAGALEMLTEAIHHIASDDVTLSITGTAMLSAVTAALINNHSTVSLMVWVIESLDLSAGMEKIMVFSMLIGADMGPKMLPVGSLAALIWLRILSTSNIRVRLLQYIALGIPITFAGTLVASLVLTGLVMLLPPA